MYLYEKNNDVLNQYYLQEKKQDLFEFKKNYLFHLDAQTLQNLVIHASVQNKEVLSEILCPTNLLMDKTITFGNIHLDRELQYKPIEKNERDALLHQYIEGTLIGLEQVPLIIHDKIKKKMVYLVLTNKSYFHKEQCYQIFNVMNLTEELYLLELLKTKFHTSKVDHFFLEKVNKNIFKLLPYFDLVFIGQKKMDIALSDFDRIVLPQAKILCKKIERKIEN